METPFYGDNHIRIFNKDCRSMDELPDGSVQCVVTSPPYFGLRKYSGDQALIWGDNQCDHQWIDYRTSLIHENRNFQKGTQEEVTAEGRELTHIHKYSKLKAGFCSLCGAWRGAYGLETDPETYVQHTIEILREIRRVLRKDGVVFLNLGDTYASGKGSCFNPGGGEHSLGKTRKEAGAHPLHRGNISDLKVSGLKPKDLCLIPFRVAIAAQEDGWYVRSVIIWNKPNPMPESVTDRPTESHEYLLMLTQSGRPLYWTHRDGPGIREKPKADFRWANQLTQEEVSIEPSDWKVKIKCPECEGTGQISVYLGLEVWQDKRCPTCHGKKETQLWKRVNLWKGHDYYWDAEAVRELSTERPSGNKERKYRSEYGGPEAHTGRQGFSIPYEPNGTGRNLRSVWTFATVPFPSFKIDGRKVDHFAVFPEKLPELCIKAATPEVGCCSKCGSPWARVLENKGKVKQGWGVQTKIPPESGGHTGLKTKMINTFETVGWQPSCKCEASQIPSLVLDPLMGAGTTLLVAKNLNRHAVGYELSEEYCQLAVERCRQQVLI